MGTSVSHPSPRTPGWNAVAASYSTEAIAVQRVAQELWRAAASQPEASLTADLGHPLVSKLGEIAISVNDRMEAVQAGRRLVAAAGETSLAIDIAHRALSLSFTKAGDRSQSFAQALFAQAANYLVSRDLAGFVGRTGRIHNVSEAIALKAALADLAAATVRTVPLSSSVFRDASSWRAYVHAVVARLVGSAPNA